MQDNQLAMDDMSNKLRWTKVSEEGTISVWRKPSLCTGEDPDSAW